MRKAKNQMRGVSASPVFTGYGGRNSLPSLRAGWQWLGFHHGSLPDATGRPCFFIAADFDKATWQDDARAFLETCRVMNLPAALERSRSGNSGHVWLFFSEAIPASLARKLGSHILTETMDRRPDIGLDSYDRFDRKQFHG
jgi:hypothetical protein